MPRKKFTATLERGGDSLNWTIIYLPEAVSKSFGTRGQIRVTGAINGFDFRSTLFPDGKGNHLLIVNKTMQKGASVKAGDGARFELERDTEERMVEIPPELKRMLAEDKGVQRFYEKLNPSTRRDIARWVGEAKQKETRLKRAEDVAERLMQVMDGEREPPPILLAAFHRDPRARRGWELMPPSHKRQHLFGIFYYRTPEARDRRVAKAIEMMIEYAEKRREAKRTQQKRRASDETRP